jgi:hypothetical protein
MPAKRLYLEGHVKCEEERMDGDNRTYRAGELTIAWQPSGLIGRVSLDGEHWASVEWSEKRQQWCIEDVEGRCLTYTASIRGQAASKEEAVALAEAMVRDGRMPTPDDARAEAKERRRTAGAKKRKALLDALAGEMTARDGRAPTPREVLAESASRRRAEEQKREEDREAEREASRLASEIEADERNAQPLYETLDEAFDLGDPELWRSNSFAALKPRLTIHVEAAIAQLTHRVAYEDRHGGRNGIYRRGMATKLDRAKAIYRKLTGAEWAPRLSKMSQALAQIAAQTAKQEREAAAVAGEEARHA